MLESLPEHEPLDETGVQEYGLLHRTLEMIRPEFEERTWRAFWAMTVDGRQASEVGEELGMAANAVHQARFRVLRRLREEMAGRTTVGEPQRARSRPDWSRIGLPQVAGHVAWPPGATSFPPLSVSNSRSRKVE